MQEYEKGQRAGLTCGHQNHVTGTAGRARMVGNTIHQLCLIKDILWEYRICFHDLDRTGFNLGWSYLCEDVRCKDIAYWTKLRAND